MVNRRLLDNVVPGYWLTLLNEDVCMTAIDCNLVAGRAGTLVNTDPNGGVTCRWCIVFEGSFSAYYGCTTEINSFMNPLNRL